MQAAALFLVLPHAIVLELLGKVTLGQSMLIALAGTALFFIGLSLARSAG